MKKHLHLFLTYHWFDEIESGRKKIEYRIINSYWSKRLIPAYIDSNYYKGIILHRGYTNRILIAKIKKVKAERGQKSDLKIDKVVFAIYFELIKN